MFVYVDGKVDGHFRLAPPPDVRSQSPRAHPGYVWDQFFERTTDGNARKTSMRIRDLLGEKQTMAGDGLGRIVVRLGELSWDAKSWEGSQGDRDLVGFQIRAC
jgi:hypothetical protein